MRDLLPPTVAVALAGSTDWTGEPPPAERPASARAVESRRRDSTPTGLRPPGAGRFGLASVPVLSADDRSPVWLAGVVGTITHTRVLRRRCGPDDEIRCSAWMPSSTELIRGRRLICLPMS
jgi:hypothetical protein